MIPFANPMVTTSVGLVFIAAIFLLTVFEIMKSARNVKSLKSESDSFDLFESQLKIKLPSGFEVKKINQNNQDFKITEIHWGDLKVLSILGNLNSSTFSKEELEDGFKVASKKFISSLDWDQFTLYEMIGIVAENSPETLGVYCEGVSNEEWHRMWWFPHQEIEFFAHGSSLCGDSDAQRKREAQDNLLESLSF